MKARVRSVGDMLVVGAPSDDFARALDLIARHIHAEFDRLGGIPGLSRRTCILVSLTIRDVLRGLGFADAEVAPVALVCQVIANAQRQLNWAVGLNLPGRKARPTEWLGHMVVIVPSAGFLIDATLYQLPEDWRGPRAMAAVPLLPAGAPPILGCPALGNLAVAKDGTQFEMAWLHRPENESWRSNKDALETALRSRVVQAVTQKMMIFG